MPEQFTRDQEIEYRAKVLVSALDRMWGTLSLSESVRVARDELRAALRQGDGPRERDRADAPTRESVHGPR